MQTWLLGDACVVGLVGQASKEPGRPGLVWVAVEGCPEELPSVLPRHCRSGLSCSFVASLGCQSYLDSGFSNAFLLSGKASPSITQSSCSFGNQHAAERSVLGEVLFLPGK